MGVGLADVAAEYVRLHRAERQSLQILSVNRVELTVMQNLWADRVGKARLDIRSAPEVVMRAIERSKRGHELFDRVRETPVLVVYELKTLT
ncbi:MAG: hypothetical protein Q3X83_07965 [Bifidobacterium sp.]|uniref:hypothetical protein n=1 Tax=Bifidobacterium pseudocatenulatum TaxID=28026 RepID=UPI001A5DCBAF|nr:hypothetical protein [Bifidobacterium longum subsp. longum]MDN4189294.1 hypothetical protein [Bifidobacterium longum subsp. longum]MDR3875094.1 hypothetical protein [Bifidobacterium sp.]